MVFIRNKKTIFFFGGGGVMRAGGRPTSRWEQKVPKNKENKEKDK